MQVRLPDLDPHLASLKQFALEVRAMQVAVDRPAKSGSIFSFKWLLYWGQLDYNPVDLGVHYFQPNL